MSHYNIIRSTLAKEFNVQDEPYYCTIKNCQVIKAEIKDLWSVEIVHYKSYYTIKNEASVNKRKHFVIFFDYYYSIFHALDSSLHSNSKLSAIWYTYSLIRALSQYNNTNYEFAKIERPAERAVLQRILEFGGVRPAPGKAQSALIRHSRTFLL